MRDEDDWVGVPPEGHHTADKAKPDFWRAQYGSYALGAGVLVAIVLLVLLIALLA